MSTSPPSAYLSLRPDDVIDILYESVFPQLGREVVRRTVVSNDDARITLRDESDGREYVWARPDLDRFERVDG